jgi:hypothetical protein
MTDIILKVDELDIDVMRKTGIAKVNAVAIDDDTVLYMTATISKKKGAGKPWLKISEKDLTNKK